MPIENICLRDDVEIPWIISRCVEEVERRGMDEVGIYRLSGSITVISQLRKKFDLKPLNCAMHDVDINCITGLLKSFLRQLPVALFTDKLHQDFIAAFHSLFVKDAKTEMDAAVEAENDRTRVLLTLFSSLPKLNQTIILYLLKHLVRVSNNEGQNKMSLNNLATVFGPSLMWPALLKSTTTADLPTYVGNGTIDVLAQSGVLYFFLRRLKCCLPVKLPE